MFDSKVGLIRKWHEDLVYTSSVSKAVSDVFTVKARTYRPCKILPSYALPDPLKPVWREASNISVAVLKRYKYVYSYYPSVELTSCTAGGRVSFFSR
jgi:hypothetical protein